MRLDKYLNLEVFKIMRAFLSVPVDSFFEISEEGRTQGHTKLAKHRTDRDLRHHFFSERVVNRWNQLDQDMDEASSINSFKRKLEKLRLKRMDFTDLSLQSPLAVSSAPLGAATQGI